MQNDLEGNEPFEMTDPYNKYTAFKCTNGSMQSGTLPHVTLTAVLAPITSNTAASKGQFDQRALIRGRRISVVKGPNTEVSLFEISADYFTL